MPATPVSFIQALLDRGRSVQPTVVGRAATLPPSISHAVPRTAQSPLGGGPSAYDGLIQAAAAKHHLDPNLLKAVAKTESNFNPTAVSPAGAKGMMQIMDFNLPSLGVSNPFDPAQSIEGGAQMLRRLLDKYGGDMRRAVAAYNAGSGAVDKYGGVPPFKETQTYVTRVLDTLHSYAQPGATKPLAPSPGATPVVRREVRVNG